MKSISVWIILEMTILMGNILFYILKFKNCNCDSPNSPLKCAFTLSTSKIGYINNITGH